MHLWWENKVEYICTKGRAVLSHNLDGRAYCIALTGLLSNCSPRLSCWFKFSWPVSCWAGMESTSFWDEDLSFFKNLPFLQLKITLKWLLINGDTKLIDIRVIRAWMISKNIHKATAKNSFRKELWSEKIQLFQLCTILFHLYGNKYSMKCLTCAVAYAVPGPGTRLPQRPRQQQRQNRAHKVPWHSLVGCFLESADIPASSTASGPYSAQG